MGSEISKNQVVSRYDKLASLGKFPDNTFLHRSLLEMILAEFKDAKPLNMMDAGSGAGFFGLELAAMGHRVTLLDLSPEALSLAQERSLSRNYFHRLTSVIGDVENLPFQDEFFDAVVCIFVFSHLNDPGRAIRELCRTVRKDGRIVISFENKLWHAVAAGLQNKYGAAGDLISSENPVIKAYDILPPVRLYSVKGIKELCGSCGLTITRFAGLRFITSFQEPLKGIGTTDTEYLLRDNHPAQVLENMLMESEDLLCLARHFLVFCRK
jgi:ubiquinone/menaquinone biosynthesis C-methylase UbiE